ncbi:MAG: cupredoxin domain-containing protein [Candidatus Colwellbacteria bacterium]|nr:cupredoxin domain-containing protein [Candidatus Colwellbacteria bacterium]
MSVKAQLIWGMALVAAVAVIIILFLQLKPAPTQEPQLLTDEGVVVLGEDRFRPNDPDALETVEGGTRKEITETVATPEVGSSANQDVAVPTKVTQVGTVERREFDISGENQKYVPSTIVVNTGDIVKINFTAVDGNYDIFFSDLGVYKEIIEGTTETIQFQVSGHGEYEFYCQNSCRNEVTGKLIVNE